jgi:hypothetical protein
VEKMVSLKDYLQINPTLPVHNSKMVFTQIVIVRGMVLTLIEMVKAMSLNQIVMVREMVHILIAMVLAKV